MPDVGAVAVRARVDATVARHRAVGLAVGVVRAGSLELVHAHGAADVEARAPVTEDTVFRIASITTTFTAVAVMQLWERGLVDLDAPAGDCLRGGRPAEGSRPGHRHRDEPA